MWPFRKKPTVKKHDLRDVTGLPQYRDYYRAVKCINCDKQYVMDVFGGWAVEWNFKTDGLGIDRDNFNDAVKYMHSKPSIYWRMVDRAECDGKDTPTP